MKKSSFKIKFLFLALLVFFTNIISALTLYKPVVYAALEESSSSSSDDTASSEADSFLEIEDWPEAPDIVSEAALLIEADSGVIFYEKNSYKRMYPASLSKLATTLLVLENCEPDDMVYFSSNAIFSLPKGASHIAINPGEYLSVENCLYGLLLASANEVANALAEHVGDTIDNFSKMLNERMKELGASDTNFVNPTGFHDDNHYTTCYDLSLLCRELLKNKTFLKVNGTASYIIPPTNLQPLQRPVNTTHKLLRKGSTNYPGCFGGKTGQTDMAGNTLITFAERNGITLICIVLNAAKSDDVYNDTVSLLNYGFSYFKKINISENENSFDFTKNILNSDSFLLFKNPNPSLYLSEDSYVYIPAASDFRDLKYTVSTENADNNTFAQLKYHYNGHYVGTANLLITPSKFPAGINESEQANNEKDNLKTIKIFPIHIIAVVITIILIIAFIVFMRLTRISRLKHRARKRRQKF